VLDGVHRVTERLKMSDAAASDDSGIEPVAAATDAFALSSAVKHVHSNFYV